MNRKLIDRILPRGPELLRRLALAEVLGPPPTSAQRKKQMDGRERGPRGGYPPDPRKQEG